MRTISLKDLLEAGCHFGHQARKWQPAMAEYIYTKQDKIHIFDLAKTKQKLEEAADFIKTTAAKGGKVLFVGAKRQAKGVVSEICESRGIPYLTKRWLGGLFTNWVEVKKNLEYLRNLEKRLADEDEKAKYTKKEVHLWEKKRGKMMKLYGGIKEMTELPAAVFIVDSRKNADTVREARSKGIPIIAICDTDNDPKKVDYPIPANDDAVGSIKIITEYLAEAYEEGREMGEKVRVKNDKIQMAQPKAGPPRAENDKSMTNVK